MIPVSEKPAPPPVTQTVISNVMLRWLTALVVMPIVVMAVVIGGWVWPVLVTFGGVVGTLEFFALARERSPHGNAVIGVVMVVAVHLAFLAGEHLLWLMTLVAGTAAAITLHLWRTHGSGRQALLHAAITLVGVLYVGFPTAFLIALRRQPDGLLWIALILSVTWGTDTLAYFGGHRFGGRWFGQARLAPRLSPNKTFEGALFGLVGGFAAGCGCVVLGQQVSGGMLVLLATMPLVAIAGDLLESAIKRYFAVKDSHLAGFNILPGHGGVLDRVDSVLLVTAYLYLALLLGVGVA